MDSEAQTLNEAIDQFQREQGEGVISVNRVINPLLRIWKLANAVDNAVAEPIQQLLIALAGRTMTTPLELGETMDATREALTRMVTV